MRWRSSSATRVNTISATFVASYDEVRACMAAGWRDLIDLGAGSSECRRSAHADFEPIAASFKRIKNILAKAEFTVRQGARLIYLKPDPSRSVQRD